VCFPASDNLQFIFLTYLLPVCTMPAEGKSASCLGIRPDQNAGTLLLHKSNRRSCTFVINVTRASYPDRQ